MLPPDLYRRALADTPLPGQDWKGEGIHAGPWRLETSQGEIGMARTLLLTVKNGNCVQ